MRKGISYQVSLAGGPLQLEIVHCDFLPHALQSRASEVKKIPLENTLQRTMIREDTKGGQAREIEGTLLHAPDNSKALK